MASQASQKPILFSGIALLIIGILVRKMTNYPIPGLFLILFGVGLKTYYIISSIRSGEYKPGRELWLLFVGLSLFFVGLYLRKTGFIFDPLYLIVAGLTLKVLFILRFIQIVRKSRSVEHEE